MSENQLYDSQGKRLYLTPEERKAFYEAAKQFSREIRTFCHTLQVTGCRISEALETTINRVDLEQQTVTFRTLKKRQKTHYRLVPVPPDYLDSLDMVHEIRARQQHHQRAKLWEWSRTTAWRHVKAVMTEAGIDIRLPHATPKGLRHAYGIAAVLSGMPITELQKALGHADLKTTAIYLDAQGKEKRALYAAMWES